MQSHSKPSAFTFHDLTLLQAEEEAVGAAIDYEHALLALYGATRIRSFRSHQAFDLNRISNVLFAWYERGLYNPDKNRERLEKHFDAGYIDHLWCSHGAIIEYVDALCLALINSEELADAVVAARLRETKHNPFRRTVLPQEETSPPKPPPRRVHPPPMRGGVG
jgi:hypothetical protein